MSRGDWRRLDEGDVRHRPNPRGSRPRTKVRPEHAQAQVGRVVRVDRGRYRVVLDGPKAREVIAMQARELGRASIVVGDVVHVVGDTSGAEGSLARVVRVAPRTSVLRRSADDTDPSERVIVAGADQLVVVTALADPPPRPRLIDRCLVAAYDAGLDAVVCLTKADLEDDGELRALYEPLGVRVVATSVVGGGAGESATQGTPSCDMGDGGGAGESATQGTPSCDMGDGGGAGESATQGTPSCDRGDGGSAWEGRIEGVDEVRGLLAGRVSVLVGHSGVGKSTLVNALVPGAERAVGEVNLVTGRGRHTSTQVVALPLPGGGWIIDTPGIRSFGLGHVRDEHILAAFEDVAAAAEDCPRGCTHAADAPDCFIDEWVEEAGEAGRRPRLDSFRRLMESRAEEKVGR